MKIELYGGRFVHDNGRLQHPPPPSFFRVVNYSQNALRVFTVIAP